MTSQPSEPALTTAAETRAETRAETPVGAAVGAAVGTGTAVAPLVVVCLCHTDLRPDVDPLTGAVTRDLRGAGIAPAEQAALEHALRIADAWGGAVLAVAAGPPAADETCLLYTCPSPRDS